jgi:hypothetical protein
VTFGGRNTPFARARFAAEWDCPSQPGRVIRHWFDTRDEALEALKGASPWLSRSDRLPTEKPPWLLH